MHYLTGACIVKPPTLLVLYNRHTDNHRGAVSAYSRSVKDSTILAADVIIRVGTDQRAC